jgi:hypothetical protein
MNIFSGDFYIILYFVYTIFGYNIWTRLITKQKIEYINNDSNTTAYWLRRITKLSQNSLLLSAYYLYYPISSLYISVILVHLVILVGYYMKWGFYDPLCYIAHIFSAIPVSLSFPIEYSSDYYPLYYTVFVLLLYYFAQNIIYI